MSMDRDAAGSWTTSAGSVSGGYFTLIVVRTSALPWRSAMTWFKANTVWRIAMRQSTVSLALPQQVTAAGREFVPARDGSFLSVSGGGREDPAPPPQQVPEPGDDDHGTDRAESGDDVVDRGDEVVGGVADGGREAPAVGRGLRRRCARLGQREGDRAVGSVVVEVFDLAFQLL